ncbi:MAG: hypothetical protein WA653_14265, partial [Candidatus Sulfotelmatobacter sp.]
MKKIHSVLCPQSLRAFSLIVIITCTLVSVLCSTATAQKLAITFDDLPLNGSLPPGVTRVETTK